MIIRRSIFIILAALLITDSAWANIPTPPVDTSLQKEGGGGIGNGGDLEEILLDRLKTRLLEYTRTYEWTLLFNDLTPAGIQLYRDTLKNQITPTVAGLPMKGGAGGVGDSQWKVEGLSIRRYLDEKNEIGWAIEVDASRVADESYLLRVLLAMHDMAITPLVDLARESGHPRPESLRERMRLAGRALVDPSMSGERPELGRIACQQNESIGHGRDLYSWGFIWESTDRSQMNYIRDNRRMEKIGRESKDSGPVHAKLEAKVDFMYPSSPKSGQSALLPQVGLLMFRLPETGKQEKITLHFPSYGEGLLPRVFAGVADRLYGPHPERKRGADPQLVRAELLRCHVEVVQQDVADFYRAKGWNWSQEYQKPMRGQR